MIEPYYERLSFKLFQSDSVELLKTIPENSVDMIFADLLIFYQVEVFRVKTGRW